MIGSLCGLSQSSCSVFPAASGANRWPRPLQVTQEHILGRYRNTRVLPKHATGPETNRHRSQSNHLTNPLTLSDETNQNAGWTLVIPDLLIFLESPDL